MFIYAKDLLIEAKAQQTPPPLNLMRAPGDPRQWGAQKMHGSSMSDEFDSLNATEKAVGEAALNNAKRPSDDVAQTAPVNCRYTKSGVCANIAGFCLCRQANFAAAEQP